MPLTNVKLLPGFDKTDTPSGAEGRWIDGDFVRFRYAQPEKIGGFAAIGQKTIAGPARAQHTWTDLQGRKYAAIGTSKVLLIYYEDAFYDVTPLDTGLTGATFTSVNGQSTVTVNKTAHGLVSGDYFLFESVTLPGGGATSFTTANFTDQTFEVITAAADTFTITMASSETGTGMTAAGSATIRAYAEIGPTIQTYGYGWGTGTWGGNVSGALTNTLNGLLQNDTAGTGGSGTSITLTSATGFSASGGTILVDQEIITYTGVSSNDLTGITRGAQGTSTAAHSSGATVTEITNFISWGQQTTTSSVILDPGNWSLDNFGAILTATIRNGKTFTWDPRVSNPLNNRCTEMASAPTKSVSTIVSDRDRHFIHFGTETTVGDNTSQDPMFIRFSDQENFNLYNPTSTNTAGTFRLDTGNTIVTAVNGKDYVLILTDQAAYTMQFVGPPFTFSIRQVGTNCGCIGPHAAVYADGKVFWMGNSGGFFVFDGTVKLLPSLVEDFVFTTDGDNLGINYASNQIVFGAHNSLYNEILWFYPKGTPTTGPSVQIDRTVTYNYVENTWATMSLARTTYADSVTYANPYATEYDSTTVPQFPTIQGATNKFGSTTYFEHERGVNKINLNGTEEAISCFVQSGDFDLPVEGDGQFLLNIRRFLPDFKNLSGNVSITLGTKDFPIAGNTTTISFVVNSATSKIDTRVRGRLANIKIENSALNDNWRFGTFRADVSQDGMR
jgi:hypothetical protein